MDKPFNPAIADNLRNLLPEKRGTNMDKHPSYDLFSYLFELLRLKLNGRKAIVDFASQYHDTRKKWTDFKSIDKQVFKTNSIRSPGMAWQVAELIYGGFYAEALPETDRLDREIKDLSSKIRKAKESKNLGKEKSLKGKKRDLNKQKDAIRSFMDKKAIWGMHYGGFPIMAYYFRDDYKDREVDALTLPPFCFRMKLKVKMKMKTPIVIKGDRPFVANENPFCTEKVTGWPLLRSSSLKGQARHATLACLSEEISDQNERRERIDWLFGSGSEEKEEGHKGRVEFLPCYIEKEVDFDVIAPHDEKTRRVDPGPVTLEVIRPDTLPLWLQYWPLDLMTKWITGKGEGIGEKLFDDFACILKGLSYWLESVGIGAKTSSGYGQVDYEGVKVEIFCSDDSPWKKLMEKIGIKPEKAPKLKELYEATEKESTKDSWQEIWKAFEQGLKQEGDENAG